MHIPFDDELQVHAQNTWFTRYGEWDFVGLRNYANLLLDDRIRNAYVFTFQFAIVTDEPPAVRTKRWSSTRYVTLCMVGAPPVYCVS